MIDGTVRKPAKRPGSNPGILWVRLPPVLLAEGSLGWCSSRRPVKPLPSSCEAEGGRFDSFITHSVLHGPLVYRQDTWFSARRGEFDSRTGYSFAVGSEFSQAWQAPGRLS